MFHYRCLKFDILRLKYEVLSNNFLNKIWTFLQFNFWISKVGV